MNIAIIAIFVIGYAAIALEHSIKINKAATALVTGVLCWTVYILNLKDFHEINEALYHHMGEISGILFFLLGAMTIVELIDAHDGFDILSEQIRARSKRKLIWIVSLLSFFLSAVLDNLTTTIVMVSLANKLLHDSKDRLFFSGMIVIASNAGGAWSPIGDVTTTMLWIGGQISAWGIIRSTFLPSLACLLVPLFIIGLKMGGDNIPPVSLRKRTNLKTPRWEKVAVFTTGIVCLLLVPVFKTYTHLPPFMGMLLGLGIMWIITELIHSGKDEMDRDRLTVNFALRKIDSPSILFFLGILISVSALQATGILSGFADQLDAAFGSATQIVLSIGLLSSIVDNVPLVAAAQGMYATGSYPLDHAFWQFLAYCCGTGGSVLIIGSAAGIAAMGISKIEFFWYVRKIAPWALLGYFSGALFFLMFQSI